MIDDDERQVVIEANVVERVPLLSQLPRSHPVCVVAGHAFDTEQDLPSTLDRVTVVCGKRVIRGHVLEMPYIVEIDE